MKGLRMASLAMGGFALLLVAACGGGAAPAAPTAAPTTAPAAKAAVTTAPAQAASPTTAAQTTKAATTAPAAKSSSPTTSASPDAAAGEPRAALSAAFEKMVDVQSFRFRGESQSSGQLEQISGEMVPPNTMRISAKEGEIVILPDTFYVKEEGGQWVGLKIPADQAANQTPSVFNPAQEMRDLSGAQNFKLVGLDVVDGTPTTVYSYEETINGQPATTKMWIGVADNLPRKVEQSIGGQVDSTFFFSDYGQVPPIQAPEGAEVLDLNQMGKDLPTLPVPTPGG